MKQSNYNDGYIRVYEEIPVKANFGAKENVKSTDDLKFIVKLAYEECSKRQEDINFAESSSRSLSMKVKTPLYKKINNEYKVIIENTLYDIIDIDEDRKNRDLYFYLEEVRTLE